VGGGVGVGGGGPLKRTWNDSCAVSAGNIHRALRWRFSETAFDEFRRAYRNCHGHQEYGMASSPLTNSLSPTLGSRSDRVDVLMGDTARTPSGLTGGSRALASGGTGALFLRGGTHRHRTARSSLTHLGVSEQDVRLPMGYQRARHDLRLDVIGCEARPRDPRN